MIIISVHDQISEKNVALIIKGGKLSAKTLAKAMKAFMSGGKKMIKNMSDPQKMANKGKQTVKQLTRQGVGASNIEITDKNIKAFERTARKYGVDFALKKDTSEIPPKWLVFFKGRDIDAINAAFKEFSAQQLKRTVEKPSVLQTLRNFMEKVANQVVDKTKHKDKGREL